MSNEIDPVDWFFHRVFMLPENSALYRIGEDRWFTFKQESPLSIDVETLLWAADDAKDHSCSPRWMMPFTCMLVACHHRTTEWYYLVDRISFMAEEVGQIICQQGLARECEDALAAIINGFINRFPFDDTLLPNDPHFVIRDSDRDDFLCAAITLSDRLHADDGSRGVCQQIVSDWLLVPQTAERSANVVVSLVSNWVRIGSRSASTHLKSFQQLENSPDVFGQHFLLAEKTLKRLYSIERMETFRSFFG